MRRIRFSNLAIADLENIAAYIEKDSVEVARRVVNRIEETCFALAEFPELGTRAEVPQTRKIVVPSLPYKIIYELYGKPQSVVILRVYHGAREIDEDSILSAIADERLRNRKGKWLSDKDVWWRGKV